MNMNELTMLQALPLDLKIAKTKLRIREWVDYYGVENVYISFSGGKDSTVLLDLVRSEYPDIEAVFVDTGLEYPELKEFVKTFENVTILRPKLSFKQVIEKYGYPIISKEQSRYLYDVRHGTEKMKNLRLNGTEQGNFKLSKKYYYLIDAPFEISNKCCDVMKKQPLKTYEKQTGKKPFIGVMADESNMRTRNYLKYGCNSFDLKSPSSKPLSFWKQQDILEYIYTNNLKIAPVYGDIIKEDDLFRTTGCNRTGCIFCGYGLHLEKEPNRFQMLEETHPQLYRYCMENLGFKEVCEFMNIPYKNEEENEEDISKIDDNKGE